MLKVLKFYNVILIEINYVGLLLFFQSPQSILKENLRNAIRNPKVPREKHTTGGTDFGNSEDKCNMVPSPPNVIAKSTVRVYSCF